MSRWNQQACCFPEIFRAHQGALLWFNNIAGSLTLFWTGKQKSKHIWGVKGSYNINLPCQATPQELGPSFNYSVFGGQNLLTNSFGIWINMFCPSKNIHTPSDSRLLNSCVYVTIFHLCQQIVWYKTYGKKKLMVWPQRHSKSLGESLLLSVGNVVQWHL